MIWTCLLIAIVMSLGMTTQASLATASENEEQRMESLYERPLRLLRSLSRKLASWKSDAGWDRRDALPSSRQQPRRNIQPHEYLGGKSQDRRQTLDEFAAPIAALSRNSTARKRSR